MKEVKDSNVTEIESVDNLYTRSFFNEIFDPNQTLIKISHPRYQEMRCRVPSSRMRTYQICQRPMKNISRPKILAINGLSIQDFRNQEEALENADRLIAKNKIEFAHDGAAEIDDEMPLLNKYRYVEGKGLKRTWAQQEVSTLEGTAHLKGQKQLADCRQFMEGMGLPATSSRPALENGVAKDGATQIVSAAWQEGWDLSVELRTSSQVYTDMYIGDISWIGGLY